MNKLYLSILLSSLATSSFLPAEQINPFRADRLVQRFSVNTHFSYNRTVYDPVKNSDFAIIKRALKDLKIRNCRDGFDSFRLTLENKSPERARRRMQEIHSELGIQFSLVIKALNGYNVHGSKIDDWLNFISTDTRSGRSRINTSWFNNLEGPNEYDQLSNQVENWAQRLLNFQANYATKIRNHRLAGIKSKPIVCPALTFPDRDKKWNELASKVHSSGKRIWHFHDKANLHHYTSGRNLTYHMQPGPTWTGRLKNAQKLSTNRNKGIYITEFGYHNATRSNEGQSWTSEKAVAKYLPRFLVWMAGINSVERVSMYEFIDIGSDKSVRTQNWGLLRNDLSRKPVYKALRALFDQTAAPNDNHTTRQKF